MVRKAIWGLQTSSWEVPMYEADFKVKCVRIKIENTLTVRNIYQKHVQVVLFAGSKAQYYQYIICLGRICKTKVSYEMILCKVGYICVLAVGPFYTEREYSLRSITTLIQCVTSTNRIQVTLRSLIFWMYVNPACCIRHACLDYTIKLTH